MLPLDGAELYLVKASEEEETKNFRRLKGTVAFENMDPSKMSEGNKSIGQFKLLYFCVNFLACMWNYIIQYLGANFNLPAQEFYPVREKSLASLLYIVSLAWST